MKQTSAVSPVLTDDKILYMSLRTGIEIHLAGYAGKAPEVLILQVRTVTPAHHLHGNEVASLLQILGNVELRSHLGVFAVAYITAIDPQLQVAGGRAYMEQYLLPLPAFRQCEHTTIGAGIVLRLANGRRIVLEGRTPGIADILVDTVAMTIELEESGNRKILPLRVIILHLIEIARGILMILHKVEAPCAFHRQVT